MSSERYSYRWGPGGHRFELKGLGRACKWLLGIVRTCWHEQPSSNLAPITNLMQGPSGKASSGGCHCRVRLWCCCPSCPSCCPSCSCCCLVCRVLCCRLLLVVRVVARLTRRVYGVQECLVQDCRTQRFPLILQDVKNVCTRDGQHPAASLLPLLCCPCCRCLAAARRRLWGRPRCCCTAAGCCSRC